jgi:hypothetical protein
MGFSATSNTLGSATFAGPFFPTKALLRMGSVAGGHEDRSMIVGRLQGESIKMTSFVLVHGAWHGSWCWKRVRNSLQEEGHEVFTPTLTGVGERSHLSSPQVNLETHNSMSLI